MRVHDVVGHAAYGDVRGHVAARDRDAEIGDRQLGLVLVGLRIRARRDVAANQDHVMVGEAYVDERRRGGRHRHLEIEGLNPAGLAVAQSFALERLHHHFREIGFDRLGVGPRVRERIRGVLLANQRDLLQPDHVRLGCLHGLGDRRRAFGELRCHVGPVELGDSQRYLRPIRRRQDRLRGRSDVDVVRHHRERRRLRAPPKSCAPGHGCEHHHARQADRGLRYRSGHGGFTSSSYSIGHVSFQSGDP